VVYKGILEKKSQNFWGQSVAARPHLLATWPTPKAFLTQFFLIAFHPFRTQRLCCGMVKFQGKDGFSPFKSLNSSPSPSLLF
jgi:hypothetical protein